MSYNVTLTKCSQSVIYGYQYQVLLHQALWLHVGTAFVVTTAVYVNKNG